ncbi:radical SAM protein, partial [Patescibacteria group bacterium]|nr:radical SAM protein [Patescibacteria group bacterium]
FSNIPFTCNTTVNMVSDDMLKAMKRAGCHGLAIGMETGREWLRIKELNKPFTDEEIYRTASLIKKNGLSLTLFTMLGLPKESVDDMFATIRMCRKINANNVRATFLSPIPKTRMTERAMKEGILKASYDDQSEAGKLLTPVFNYAHRRETENLFYLFEVALRSSLLERIVRFIIRFPLPPVIKLSLLPRLYREKKFFNITLWSGFVFFLKTTLPQNRTKNFNNYLP